MCVKGARLCGVSNADFQSKKRATALAGRACLMLVAMKRQNLLNFAFNKLNMFAHNWVVLVHAQFFGLGAGVLLGHIKEASAS
jgi:hypothetical protein